MGSIQSCWLKVRVRIASIIKISQNSLWGIEKWSIAGMASEYFPGSRELPRATLWTSLYCFFSPQNWGYQDPRLWNFVSTTEPFHQGLHIDPKNNWYCVNSYLLTTRLFSYTNYCKTKNTGVSKMPDWWNEHKQSPVMMFLIPHGSQEISHWISLIRAEFTQIWNNFWLTILSLASITNMNKSITLSDNRCFLKLNNLQQVQDKSHSSSFLLRLI